MAGSQQALPCSLQVGLAGAAGAPPAPAGAGAAGLFWACAAGAATYAPATPNTADRVRPIRTFRCAIGPASFIYMRARTVAQPGEPGRAPLTLPAPPCRSSRRL